LEGLGDSHRAGLTLHELETGSLKFTLKLYDPPELKSEPPSPIMNTSGD
jgi:hypothetical protein